MSDDSRHAVPGLVQGPILCGIVLILFPKLVRYEFRPGTAKPSLHGEPSYGTTQFAQFAQLWWRASGKYDPNLRSWLLELLHFTDVPPDHKCWMPFQWGYSMLSRRVISPFLLSCRAPFVYCRRGIGGGWAHRTRNRDIVLHVSLFTHCAVSLFALFVLEKCKGTMSDSKQQASAPAAASAWG